MEGGLIVLKNREKKSLTFKELMQIFRYFEWYGDDIVHYLETEFKDRETGLYFYMDSNPLMLDPEIGDLAVRIEEIGDDD